MRWSCPEIADAVECGLREQALADDAEQAVYGFDARDELGLHPLIHASLRGAPSGWGIWPEQRYPGHWHKASKAEGKRCDIVLTPDTLPMRDPAVKATLFDATPAVDACEAYWLEVKTVAQFEVGGPFRGYTRELLSPVAEDVKKLWADGVIQHAGLLLVLFTRDRETCEHDMLAWHQRCMQRKLPVGPPALRGFAITDRIGNGWCGLGVFGVRGW